MLLPHTIMEGYDHKHVVIEPKTKGELWVMAPRQLSHEEVSEAVATYLSSKKNKRPKRGQRILLHWTADL